ncbi:MAG: hypothetical protein HC925_03850 [Coleofasciculaceae cyanobacterium SM2_3_26]|nr:hypothetical protein [Coleofasciculaceae cyanobacterium SM2_3_26]
MLGDPEFRNNLRRLIEGLSELVSLGEQLEQQTIVAYELAPLAEALQAARPIDPAPTHEAVHEAAPKLVKQDAAEVSPAMPQWMAPE